MEALWRGEGEGIKFPSGQTKGQTRYGPIVLRAVVYSAFFPFQFRLLGPHHLLKKKKTQNKMVSPLLRATPGRCPLASSNCFGRGVGVLRPSSPTFPLHPPNAPFCITAKVSSLARQAHAHGSSKHRAWDVISIPPFIVCNGRLRRFPSLFSYRLCRIFIHPRRLPSRGFSTVVAQPIKALHAFVNDAAEAGQTHISLSLAWSYLVTASLCPPTVAHPRWCFITAPRSDSWPT